MKLVYVVDFCARVYYVYMFVQVCFETVRPNDTAFNPICSNH